MGSSKDSDIPQVFMEFEPQHEVTISKPFYLGQTEVTNAQFSRFLQESRYEPRVRAPERLCKHLYDDQFAAYAGPDNPVVFVNWHDAREFCKWLGEREKRRYRLPTEEEWQYACRSGTRMKYGCTSNERKLLDFAWLKENTNGHPHPVGTRRANYWGLYDMNGNVWEWTGSIIPQRVLRDTPFHKRRCAFIRGGAFFNGPGSARCAARWAGWPLETRSKGVGFRVVWDGKAAKAE